MFTRNRTLPTHLTDLQNETMNAKMDLEYRFVCDHKFAATAMDIGGSMGQIPPR
jgi:hypothetical protein